MTLAKDEIGGVAQMLERAMKELIYHTIDTHGDDARVITFTALQMVTVHCLRAEYFARKISPGAEDPLEWYIKHLRVTVADHKRLLGPMFDKPMGG